jgi:hypothetical protein
MQSNGDFAPIFFELCDFAPAFRGRRHRLPLLVTPLGDDHMKKNKRNREKTKYHGKRHHYPS